MILWNRIAVFVSLFQTRLLAPPATISVWSLNYVDCSHKQNIWEVCFLCVNVSHNMSDCVSQQGAQQPSLFAVFRRTGEELLHLPLQLAYTIIVTLWSHLRRIPINRMLFSLTVPGWLLKRPALVLTQSLLHLRVPVDGWVKIYPEATFRFLTHSASSSERVNMWQYQQVT